MLRIPKPQFTNVFSSVQLLSPIRLFVTPWTAVRQYALSITNSWSLLKFVSIESVMPSNHLILCRPLLLLPSIFPSIRGFSSQSVLHIRWPKYWSFSFSISPQDWFPLGWTGWISLLSKGLSRVFSNTTVQNQQIWGCLAFFIVQLSHLYMTTGKTIALTRQTFVDRCFKAQQLQFFLVTSQLLVSDSSCCGYKIFLNDFMFSFGKTFDLRWTGLTLAPLLAWIDKKVFLHFFILCCVF